MATHSSILAWRIPRTEEPGGLKSVGWQESDTPERLNTQARGISWHPRSLSLTWAAVARTPAQDRRALAGVSSVLVWRDA